MQLLEYIIIFYLGDGVAEQTMASVRISTTDDSSLWAGNCLKREAAIPRLGMAETNASA